jgi:hypothetical protein
MNIPKQREHHVHPPLLFIDLEGMIYHDLPAFYYQVFINILEVED